MVPTICMYCAYVSSLETDPFSGDYEAVLEPYLIDLTSVASPQMPASAPHKIYASNQQGDLTAFLLWHATPGLAKDRDPGRLSLLHSVIHYVSWMGCPARKWDNRTFANW